ncbi:DUF3165 family protein [Streptococcus suis]|nr:DUF3165 family protein [Streptococcus suis]
MFYMILAILLVLFYIFLAPNNVRGTINLMVAVVAVVALFIFLMLAFLKILQVSSDIWVGFIVIFIGLWAMRDIYYLDKPSRKTVRK